MRFERSSARVLPMATAIILLPAVAQAAFPFPDCQAMHATSSFAGWVYIRATAKLQQLQSGSYVDVNTVTSDQFLPSGGPYLFQIPWTITPANGTYRGVFTTVSYFGGSGSNPPTESELSSWPSNQICRARHLVSV